MLQVRRRDLAAVEEAFEAAGLAAECHLIGEREPRRPARSCAHAAGRSSRSRASRCSAPGPRRVTDADAARQSGVRAGGVRPHARRRRSRPAREAHLRSGGRHRRAFIARGARPRIAILREQGVNGQVEMAAAFDRAGFDAVDVHMSDIIAGRVSAAGLPGLRGLRRLLLRRRAGRGRGLGQVDPVQPARARRVRGVLPAQRFLRARRVQRLPDDEQPARPDPGRRALAALRAQPLRAVRGALRDGGGDAQPVAVLRGHGGQPHARSPSRMARAMPSSQPGAARSRAASLRCASSTTAAPDRAYPLNPNGSPEGITGLTTADGRFTILMPHPERVFRTVQNSWHPEDWGEDGPWMRMFRNARKWVG